MSFNRDVDLCDVLQEWFGEQKADENAVTDIDAFLYDAMFPENVDFDIANQTEEKTEQETATAIEQDLDLGKLFGESDHDVMNELEFISLENLQSHEARCKSKNFKFRCIHCNWKFTRALYRDLHTQNCDRNVGE